MNFENLDMREFILHKGFTYIISLRQIEILRIIKALEQRGSNKLALKLKRVIYLRDINEKTKTEFNRKLPKGDIELFVMPKKDYYGYLRNQRELDKEMGAFYNENKRKI